MLVNTTGQHAGEVAFGIDNPQPFSPIAVLERVLNALHVDHGSFWGTRVSKLITAGSYRLGFSPRLRSHTTLSMADGGVRLASLERKEKWEKKT